jgi:PAS domain S-box-containing protein
MSRILVVEDEAITAMDLRETLHGLGYEVVGLAMRGIDAIDFVERSRPDLVLMDILLDGTPDGITTAETIRERFAVPVIFATSQTDDATVNRAMNASPYGFIVKPFDTRELHATIQTVITRHSLEISLTRREAELASANRALMLMGDIRIAMIESEDEISFLSRVCMSVAGQFDFAFVWIGYADRGELKKVIPVAKSGGMIGYLDDIDIRWDDSECGEYPTGRAIRTCMGFAVNDAVSDPGFAPWQEEILSRGIQSVAAQPILYGDGNIGALSVYSKSADFFDNTMIAFLEEISSVISQGIQTMRTRHEREVAEREVHDLHDFYEKILENIAEGILVIDTNGIVSYANSAVTGVTGQRREEFVGARVPEVFPHGDGGALNAVYREARETRATVSYDRLRVIRHDGVRMFRSGQMIPLLRGNMYDSMIWTMRDITEEVVAERWHHLYNLLAENSRDVILFVEWGSGRILEANDAARSLYGYSMEEFAAMTIGDLVIPGMNEIALEHVDQEELDNALFETLHRARGGESIPVEVSSRGVTLGDERLLVNIIRDIRERKTLQRQVLELGDARRRRIGRDLHDSLGQLLTGVALLVRTAKKSVERNPASLPQQLNDIERNLNTAIQTTRSLARGLTLIEPGEKGLIDGLQELAENTSRMTSVKCTFTSEAMVHIGNDAVAQHLYYVALEAVNNAIKHGGGNRVIMYLYAEGALLHLLVRDNGSFSESESSRGLGLRSMDYRARLFGGFITLVRETGWTVMHCRMNLHYSGGKT